MEVGFGRQMHDSASGEPRRHKKTIKVVAICVGFATLAVLGGVVGAVIANITHGVRVPSYVSEKAKSPIYLPSFLPGSYKVVESSFMYDEDTVLFSAKDSAGNNLVFTEQPKPADFNFDDFYKRQIIDAKNASSGDYAIVWGKTEDNRYILSVATKDTWIIMSTSAALEDDDVQRIAKEMRRQ